MSSPTEKEVLQQEADRLTAEGYEVFLQPGPSLMPVFLHGYTPDAVAYGHGRKIALEVTENRQSYVICDALKNSHLHVIVACSIGYDFSQRLDPLIKS